jgi:hypothetical protein
MIELAGYPPVRQTDEHGQLIVTPLAADDL